MTSFDRTYRINSISYIAQPLNISHIYIDLFVLCVRWNVNDILTVNQLVAGSSPAAGANQNKGLAGNG